MKRALVLIALVLASAGNARAELLTKVPAPSVAGGCALTPLADGRVLITGGVAETTAMMTSTAEVFDPTSKTWSPVAPMANRRDGHHAVRLPSGSVLVMGGKGSSGALSSAELYDPATGVWTTVGAVSRGTLSPMTVLSDGRAATVVGDGFSATYPSFEIFDATARTWSKSVTPTLAHNDLALAPLAEGGLLLVSPGGVERFAAGKWTVLPSPIDARRVAGMVRLKDGRVLVVGGGTSSAGGLPLLFSPETGAWRTLTGQRRGPGASATELVDGRVLVAGGQPIFAGEAPSVEVFDPATLNIVKLLAPPNSLSNHVAAPLGDAVLLVDRANRNAYVITPPASCSTAADCASGHCADGVCCDAACTGQCEACDTPLAIGKCVGVAGAPHGSRKECSPAYTPLCRALSCDPTRSRTECVAPVFKPLCDCTRDDECESGHCADGVCCNTACDGQCEACDLPSARGVCTPVIGEPRGIRKGCDPPGRGICSIQACNGVDTKQCTYTKAGETLCDSICGGRVQRHCNGGGVCGLPSELRCPDQSCSIRAVEPAVARSSDALWVVIAAALANRLRRRR